VGRRSNLQTTNGDDYVYCLQFAVWRLLRRGPRTKALPLLAMTAMKTVDSLTGQETVDSLTGQETVDSLTGQETVDSLTGQETLASFTGMETLTLPTGGKTGLPFGDCFVAARAQGFPDFIGTGFAMTGLTP